MLSISTSVAPFASLSIGLFFAPLNAEFGWNRAEISWCVSLLLVSSAICLPFVGRLTDRFGARAVIVPSYVMLGIGLIAIGLFVSQLWHMLLLFLMIGILSSGTQPIPFLAVLTAWFNKHRGLAIGLSVSGIGLGYAYVPILVQFMIDHHGWRIAYYSLSLIIFVVTVPIVILFLKESPAELGMHADGVLMEYSERSTSKEIGLTVKEALRIREFWLMVFIFPLLSFAIYGIYIHLVPLLVDRGMKTATAAAVASVVGVSTLISRIAVGYLLDRFFGPKVALFAFVLSGIGIVILASGATGSVVFIAAATLGLSVGAEVDILAYFSGRYFGLRGFGTICGILMAAFVFGAALGPIAFGMGFEATGSYQVNLVGCAVIVLLVLLLTSMLGDYPELEK